MLPYVGIGSQSLQATPPSSKDVQNYWKKKSKNFQKTFEALFQKTNDLSQNANDLPLWGEEVNGQFQDQNSSEVLYEIGLNSKKFVQFQTSDELTNLSCNKELKKTIGVLGSSAFIEKILPRRILNFLLDKHNTRPIIIRFTPHYGVDFFAKGSGSLVMEIYKRNDAFKIWSQFDFVKEPEKTVKVPEKVAETAEVSEKATEAPEETVKMICVCMRCTFLDGSQAQCFSIDEVKSKNLPYNNAAMLFERSRELNKGKIPEAFESLFFESLHPETKPLKSLHTEAKPLELLHPETEPLELLSDTLSTGEKASNAIAILPRTLQPADASGQKKIEYLILPFRDASGLENLKCDDMLKKICKVIGSREFLSDIGILSIEELLSKEYETISIRFITRYDDHFFDKYNNGILKMVIFHIKGEKNFKFESQFSFRKTKEGGVKMTGAYVRYNFPDDSYAQYLEQTPAPLENLPETLLKNLSEKNIIQKFNEAKFKDKLSNFCRDLVSFGTDRKIPNDKTECKPAEEYELQYNNFIKYIFPNRQFYRKLLGEELWDIFSNAGRCNVLDPGTPHIYRTPTASKTVESGVDVVFHIEDPYRSCFDYHGNYIRVRFNYIRLKFTYDLKNCKITDIKLMDLWLNGKILIQNGKNVESFWNIIEAFE